MFSALYPHLALMLRTGLCLLAPSMPLSSKEKLSKYVLNNTGTRLALCWGCSSPSAAQVYQPFQSTPYVLRSPPGDPGVAWAFAPASLVQSLCTAFILVHISCYKDSIRPDLGFPMTSLG